MRRPAYIRELRAHSKAQHGDQEDVDATVAALRNESDRGAVILAATGVEDILEWAMLSRMPTLQEDAEGYERLFGPSGPVGSFSSKIALAYGMGIIDREARDDMNVVREMRNACAHSRRSIGFENPHLQEACKRVIRELLPTLVSHEPQILRDAFVIQTTALAQYVITGKRRPIGEIIRDAAAAPGAQNVKTDPT